MWISRLRLLSSIAVRASAASIFLCLILWIGQDLLIFPLLGKRLLPTTPPLIPPDTINQITVTTPDGDSLDVWTTYGKNPELTAPYVGIIFHGNGETVASGNFLPFFARHRIPAFTFDYRGYGNSTGWISESKLLSDAELVWQEIHRRTGVPASQTIILGNSIGSAPATWLASKIKPHTLILLAGYISVPQIIADMPLYRPFTWLLRYKLSTVDYLNQVEARCVILAHGENDEIIKFRHMDALSRSVDKRKIQKLVLLADEKATHNNIYYRVEASLEQELESCLLRK